MSQVLQDDMVQEEEYEWAVCELCEGALLCMDEASDHSRGVWATRLPCGCRLAVKCIERMPAVMRVGRNRFHRECIRDYVMEASGMCDDDCEATEHVNCPVCDAALDWGQPGYEWERGGSGSEDEDSGVCGATLAFICENQVLRPAGDAGGVGSSAARCLHVPLVTHGELVFGCESRSCDIAYAGG